jgi:hypothetical protein
MGPFVGVGGTGSEGWYSSWLARWEKHEFKVLPSAESREQPAEGNQCMYDILAACCSCDADAAYLRLEGVIPPSVCLAQPPSLPLPVACNFSDALSTAVNEREEQASAMLLHVHLGHRGQGSACSVLARRYPLRKGMGKPVLGLLVWICVAERAWRDENQVRGGRAGCVEPALLVGRRTKTGSIYGSDPERFQLWQCQCEMPRRRSVIHWAHPSHSGQI